MQVCMCACSCVHLVMSACAPDRQDACSSAYVVVATAAVSVAHRFANCNAAVDSATALAAVASVFAFAVLHVW